MKIINLLLAISITILLSACGGGSGGDSAPATEPSVDSAVDTGTSTDEQDDIVESSYAPKMLLKEADYWVYKWQESSTTSSQGASPSMSSGHGEFTITLGASTTLNGVEAFPLTITGDSGTHAPRWKYLAISDDNSLIGSTGGDFTIVYSSTQTEWNGGGFFINFSNDDAVSAKSSTYEGVYNSLDAVRVSHSDSSGGCEYLLGYTFCSDNSVSSTINEHYKQGLGTVGFYERYYYTFSGGNFFTAVEREAFIELISSSLSATDGSELKQPSWKEIATLPTKLTSPSATILDKKIYILGTGSSNIQIFNIETNSFEEDLLSPLSTSSKHLYTLDNTLYVMNENESIWQLLDRDTNSWYHRNSLGSGVSTDWAYYNASENKIYDYTIHMINHSGMGTRFGVSLYDPYTNEWSSYDDPLYNNNRWSGFEIIELDNILYLIGGIKWNSTWNTWSSVESISRFDLLTNTWLSSAKEMNTPKKWLFGVIRYNGKIIVLGGTDTRDKVLATVEEYDPKTDSWTNLEALPEPLTSIKAVATQDKIYVISSSKIFSFAP